MFGARRVGRGLVESPLYATAALFAYSSAERDRPGPLHNACLLSLLTIQLYAKFASVEPLSSKPIASALAIFLAVAVTAGSSAQSLLFAILFTVPTTNRGTSNSPP
jgi:hypothetical protein